ncbi:MAG: protoporphyrin/coproporphyrin ferrochelatase [Actinomycetota bacterium]|nr:protoporphyrin/coproporphyrin ferrochelatase [Actinomycetota bacterium]
MADPDPQPVGVLVMAYGTPATPADIEPYYTHVRRGRTPPPDLLADLTRRYEAIGGTSPLLERTSSQAAGIAAALGPEFTVELGMKHAPPFIEDGVAALAARGVTRTVGLVLAPHYSFLSVGQYAERTAAAGAAHGVEILMVDSWHTAAGYLDLLAGFVGAAIDSLPQKKPDIEVVFTAHSLPAFIEASGDPYPGQLRETAISVALRVPHTRWSIAWQSAARTGTTEPWLGPDILTVLPQLASAGARGVVVCPCGFTSDHLEVLYDLDIEAAKMADAMRLDFVRTPSPNDHPALCAALADVVRARAAA